MAHASTYCHMRINFGRLAPGKSERSSRIKAEVAKPSSERPAIAAKIAQSLKATFFVRIATRDQGDGHHK
jgi:hypothetical protein